MQKTSFMACQLLHLIKHAVEEMELNSALFEYINCTPSGKSWKMKTVSYKQPYIFKLQIPRKKNVNTQKQKLRRKLCKKCDFYKARHINWSPMPHRSAPFLRLPKPFGTTICSLFGTYDSWQRGNSNSSSLEAWNTMFLSYLQHLLSRLRSNTSSKHLPFLIPTRRQQQNLKFYFLSALRSDVPMLQNYTFTSTESELLTGF